VSGAQRLHRRALGERVCTAEQFPCDDTSGTDIGAVTCVRVTERLPRGHVRRRPDRHARLCDPARSDSPRTKGIVVVRERSGRSSGEHGIDVGLLEPCYELHFAREALNPLPAPAR
jgi:hypothetical protein